MNETVKLKMLPLNQYKGVNSDDPIRYYFWPIFRKMYRRRVELCLTECKGGERVLEVGFGSGVSFLNLHEMYQEIYGLDLTASIDEVKSVFAPLGVCPDLRQGDLLHMPYSENQFDTVLLISILEHLKPHQLVQAFKEILRVLKPGGQVVYGCPIERPFMVGMFRILGHDIRDNHFSTELQIRSAAQKCLSEENVIQMVSFPSLFGAVYQVGHFVKN